MNDRQSGTLQLIGNIRGILDLVRNFGEFLPVILELLECIRGLTPEQKATASGIVARFAHPDDEAKAEEVKSQLQQLVS